MLAALALVDQLPAGDIAELFGGDNKHAAEALDEEEIELVAAFEGQMLDVSAMPRDVLLEWPAGLLADVDADDVIVADVNPIKYAPAWRTKIACMWAAMCDESVSAGAYMYGRGGPGKRARGFVRISTESSPPLNKRDWPQEGLPVLWYRQRLVAGAAGLAHQ